MSKKIIEDRVEFTKDMMDYTILAPNMLDIHFRLLINIFGQYGYKTELLQNDGRAVIDEGLKYVHNDTCYPALLVIGQLIDALNSGKYDPDKTALMITQSGGGCRASNYIHLLRKALRKAGYGHVPVISLNLSGLEKNSGFKIRLSMALKMLSAVIYGDLIMLLKNQVEPYEINVGDAKALTQKWIDSLSDEIGAGSPVCLKGEEHALAVVAILGQEPGAVHRPVEGRELRAVAAGLRVNGGVVVGGAVVSVVSPPVVPSVVPSVVLVLAPVLSPMGVPSSSLPQAVKANSIARARSNARILFISFPSN